MDAAEAINLIRECGLGKPERFFILSAHARDRAKQRGMTTADIRNAMATVATATWQPETETWLGEGGLDTTGDALTFACVVELGYANTRTIVVTVF